MQNNTKNPKHNKSRAGAIVPFVAILLPIFIALIAFAVDYGVIVVARHELQNAADAASIAAIETLFQSPESADLAAFETLTANQLHGRPVEFDMRQDVQYGVWDSTARTFTEIPRNGNVAPRGDVSGATIPSGANAVRVQLTRSRERENGIRLFFGTILGTSFADITVQSISSASAGCNGFVGIESATIINNTSTDSYNSDDGNYGPGNINDNGDVCSDGRVLVSSGASIHGNAAGSLVTIQPGSGATVSGTRSASSGQRSFDPVDFTKGSVNDNDSIPLPIPAFATQPFLTSNNDFQGYSGLDMTLNSGEYHFRDLIASNGSDLTINGDVTIYVERNMRVGGGSQLTINGEVEIFIEGEMRFDNGTVVNPSQLPRNLKLNVGQGPVNLQGGNGLHASIYAPEADVVVQNGSNFFGAIIGRTLETGGTNLHLDESLLPEAPSGGPSMLVN